uniref:Uncharacterized protein n=1 Tax=Anguilla anguilla TaxID=7936 RepID=A0A0E9XS57_ANGAN
MFHCSNHDYIKKNGQMIFK